MSDVVVVGGASVLDPNRKLTPNDRENIKHLLRSWCSVEEVAGMLCLRAEAVQEVADEVYKPLLEKARWKKIPKTT